MRIDLGVGEARLTNTHVSKAFFSLIEMRFGTASHARRAAADTSRRGRNSDPLKPVALSVRRDAGSTLTVPGQSASRIPLWKHYGTAMQSRHSLDMTQPAILPAEDDDDARQALSLVLLDGVSGRSRRRPAPIKR